MDIWVCFSIVCFLFALIPAVLLHQNLRLFRNQQNGHIQSIKTLSVLIPARNEEENISSCLQSILSHPNIPHEVIVYDDQSEDNTAEIVNEWARKDSRVRRISGTPLPNGWAGKQFACYQLSQAATSDVLCFLDADVRLTSDASVELVKHFEHRQVALLSGFPKEITLTWSEKILIPMIHWLLLCYLPIRIMRKRSTDPSLGVGCGQLFLADSKAYQQCGGHSHHRVRNSFHDGIQLPKGFRESGYSTDIIDMSDIASCRMYHNFKTLWNGLLKNAHEGFGHSRRIVPWTFILAFGHVIPYILLVIAIVRDNELAILLCLLSFVLSFISRYRIQRRFYQSVLPSVFHPMSVGLFLLIQWQSLVYQYMGWRVQWKPRKNESN